MKRYYLAYGSNLNMDQMTWRCKDAVPLGTAEIKDYRLLYKGSKSGAYLTIEKADGCTVPVAVWAVSEEDEKNLDRYEGYPTFYYKTEMKISYTGIKTGKRREINAFVYIMHEDRPFGIPSKRYVDICRIGYDDFGFNQKILSKALQNSLEELKWNRV